LDFENWKDFKMAKGAPDQRAKAFPPVVDKYVGQFYNIYRRMTGKIVCLVANSYLSQSSVYSEWY
jgi:hypothetical protein